MLPTSSACRPAAATLALAALASLVLAGCGGQAGTATGDPDPSLPAAITITAEPSLPVGETSATPSGSGIVSSALPPGDPGIGSVAEDTPGADHEHGHGPLTEIPQAALLDAETVAAVVDGSWRIAAVPAESCAAPRPGGFVATRSSALTGSGGQLWETVATHRDADTAARAVDDLADRLAGCGWMLAEEPPLGEDSALLTRTGRAAARLVIVASEGVTVTLRGRGPVADSADDWTVLVDIAIGTSCLAAPDGCH